MYNIHANTTTGAGSATTGRCTISGHFEWVCRCQISMGPPAVRLLQPGCRSALVTLGSVPAGDVSTGRVWTERALGRWPGRLPLRSTFGAFFSGPTPAHFAGLSMSPGQFAHAVCQSHSVLLYTIRMASDQH